LFYTFTGPISWLMRKWHFCLSLPATRSISLGKQPFSANLQIFWVVGPDLCNEWNRSCGYESTTLEKMPEVILNGNRINDHKVFVLMVFSKWMKGHCYSNGTGNREWPAEKQLTDKSADRTNKSIKQKPTEIGHLTKHFFIAPIKNVLFLFHLHSLVWIWTHLVCPQFRLMVWIKRISSEVIIYGYC
jgi:hypothetical protein